MAKFSGIVGYVKTQEVRPGVFLPKEERRMMRGDVTSLFSHINAGERLNDDISLNHRISVLGDAYSFENYAYIKYVELDNVKWEVSSVEIRRPRIIISFGKVYNG